MKEVGGKVIIDYFNNDDLRALLDLVNASKEGKITAATIEKAQAAAEDLKETAEAVAKEEIKLADDRSKEEREDDSAEMYSVKNFTI